MWNRAKSPGFIMRVHIILYIGSAAAIRAERYSPHGLRFKPREFVQTGSAARK